MEDFIYILIGVIWLAASIYKAANKKKKAAAPVDKAEPVRREAEGMPRRRSLLEELMGEHQVEVPMPEVREIYTEDDIEPVRAENRPRPRTFQEEYARLGFTGLEKLSNEGESATGRISFRNALESNPEKGPGQKRINLRKAIIYSTILERPYT